MEIFQKIKNWFDTSNLRKTIEDIRDLNFRDIFGAEDNYVPKYLYYILAPIFNQNQKSRSNCSFNAWADSYGVFFGEQISVRWLVAKAYQQGLCGKNGSANLMAGAKVGQKWGVVLEKDCPTDENISWEEYIKVDFVILDVLAKQRMISSYYKITNVNDALRAIDKGYAVVIGRDWLTDMSNIKEPWIIRRTGNLVGGHATTMIGYNLNGEKTNIESNSYGTEFGDKGNLYCPLTDLQKDIDAYKAYCITDVPYTPKEIKIKGLKDQITNLLKIIFNMQQKDRLYNMAKSLIGTNLAPGNEMLGCAISFSAVCNKALGDGIRFMNTDQCLKWMREHKDLWEEIYSPEPKCAIVSPTGEIPSSSILGHGHIGVVGQYNAPDGTLYVMSNSSLDRCWNTQFTLKKWEDYYQTYGKIPTYYFRRIG